MQLSRFPRVRLAHTPTPLEPMKALSAHLGGPRLFVKRDDSTGLALGGNKTRKLEFLIAEALAKGADTVITGGGIQSNHVRQTAAAAAKSGLACDLLLQRTVPWNDPDYEQTGNVFLDRLLGARLHIQEAGRDRMTELMRIAGEVEARGGKPYVIPGGGSNATGALGYVACAQELLSQANESGIVIDYVVHPTGSGGTQAGLVAGFAGLNAGATTIGIDIDADADEVTRLVTEIADATAEKLGVDKAAAEAAVVVKAGYGGEAYGLPTREMVEAVELTARLEGIVLDPVYTGKTMAGLIDLVRSGFFKPEETVVFLHTGGMPALFAYRSAFEATD